MRHLVQTRRLPLFVNGAVLVTLASGAMLLWWASGGLALSWLQSGIGIRWSTGSGFAVVAALLGQLVNAPTARRLGSLGAAAQASGGPPSESIMAEMQRLQLRLFRATQFAAILLALSAAAMASARYGW